MTDFSGSKSIKSSSGGGYEYEPLPPYLYGRVWRKPHAWPKIGPGKLFLAAALQRIGTGRFEWTGDEIGVPRDDRKSPEALRLLAAVAVLADAGRAGLLPTYLWKRMSKIRDGSAEMWFGSDNLSLLATCSVETGSGGWQVFVDEETVDRLATQSPADVEPPAVVTSTGEASGGGGQLASAQYQDADKLIRGWFAENRGWLAAWEKYRLMAQAGQVRKLSRKQFEIKFKKYDPSPKPGPKPAS